MSTTYAKIRATLAEMAKKASWNPQQQKAELIKRDKVRAENNFHNLKNSSANRRPLSDVSFEKLFEFMIELDLIKRDKSDDFVVPELVKASLDDDARYKLLLSRRVTDLLDRHDANIAEIRTAAQSINYPNVRVCPESLRA